MCDEYRVTATQIDNTLFSYYLTQILPFLYKIGSLLAHWTWLPVTYAILCARR